MDLNKLLRTAVERGASDLHLKVGQPPVIRHDGALAPLDGWAPLDAAQLELVLDEIGASAPARLAAFHETGELDTVYQQDGPPALPRQRLPPARRHLVRDARDPDEVPTFDSLRLSAGRPEPRRRAARPDPRHRRDRRRQDDDARVDARPHQPHAAAAHRHDRGSDRDPPLRRGLHRQPARGRARHGVVQRGAAARSSPGPRRDPDRRAPRQRDRPRRRSRRPSPGTSWSRRCTRSTPPRRRPDGRVLPRAASRLRCARSSPACFAASSASGCFRAATAAASQRSR